MSRSSFIKKSLVVVGILFFINEPSGYPFESRFNPRFQNPLGLESLLSLSSQLNRLGAVRPPTAAEPYSVFGVPPIPLEFDPMNNAPTEASFDIGAIVEEKFPSSTAVWEYQYTFTPYPDETQAIHDAII